MLICVSRNHGRTTTLKLKIFALVIYPIYLAAQCLRKPLGIHCTLMMNVQYTANIPVKCSLDCLAHILMELLFFCLHRSLFTRLSVSNRLSHRILTSHRDVLDFTVYSCNVESIDAGCNISRTYVRTKVRRHYGLVLLCFQPSTT
jgi:hypothetical protein